MKVTVIMAKCLDGHSRPVCMFTKEHHARQYINIVKQNSKLSNWMKNAQIVDLYCDFMDNHIIFGDLLEAIDFDTKYHGPSFIPDIPYTN